MNMVGTAGFEPATTTPPVWCATRLRYAPSFALAHHSVVRLSTTIRAALRPGKVVAQELRFYTCTPECGATSSNNQGYATPRQSRRSRAPILHLHTTVWCDFLNNQGCATPREAAIIRNQQKFASLIVRFESI